MADTPASETPKRRRATKPAASTAKSGATKTARKPRKAAAEAPAAEATATPKPKTARKPRATPAAAPAAETKAEAPKPARKPRTAAPKKEAAPKRQPRKAAAPKPSEAPKSGVSAPAVVEKAVSAVKRAVPEVPPRAGLFAALGTAAVAAGAFFVWRASRAEEPRYQTVESDGPIEVRKYPAMVTAGTEHRGERQAALNEGFRTLADYISAKSRPGKKISMAAPVLSDSDGDGSWRTRFIMPVNTPRAELPSAPLGVELTSEPARRVAAMRFSGSADDATLASKEGALRSWLQIRGLPSEGRAVHAFYNAPFLPGPMRRNEVMIVLSEEGGMGL
ncbi:heme-binding protein [Sphingomonas tabacisoli]|uniref:Heme-binding protein n=1 Tax=Sphingomonas tabacisoli TaxID=2249466 RepID=A0ABW4HZD8_9SPHN